MSDYQSDVLSDVARWLSMGDGLLRKTQDASDTKQHHVEGLFMRHVRVLEVRRFDGYVPNPRAWWYCQTLMGDGYLIRGFHNWDVMLARVASVGESPYTRWYVADIPAVFRGRPVALGGLMNKYLRAVREKAKAVRKGSVSAADLLGDKRPALTAFMTELDAGEGQERELSALMVIPGPDGFKVGLKDEDAGGWLWRSGNTVTEALDAMEEALADGTARFTTSQRQGGKKGGKRS